MNEITDHPYVVFAISIVLLWISAQVGVQLGKRGQDQPKDERDDFSTILAAALTLLGLIVGFSFSMAISRYDERKNLEEAEANAIGTEYARADLLPPANAARVRVLLKSYLDQRILFYQTRHSGELVQINIGTERLQADLWDVVQAAAAAQPTPVMALVVSGMNDVLNSQGYTQAAWRNRIPIAAWGLMVVIAIYCNGLIGYGARRATTEVTLFFVLPLALSISFFFIADIDSPNAGAIRVHPINLTTLARSLQPH
jgi:hypothetical protein